MTLLAMPFEVLPASASATSDAVDLVVFLVFAVIGLVSLGVIAAMVVIVVRYRRRPGNLTGRGHDHATIWRTEIGWCALTAVVFLGLFTIGAVTFDRIERVPTGPDVLDVAVTAKRWMWSFQHPNGRRELSQLHVPAGRVVRLHLTSEDVIHSFYVPAFRLKQDVVPGWLRTAWFRATAPGTYALACAEYCGTEHALMRADVVVMEPHNYDHWLAQGDDPRPPLAAAGRALFHKLDCGACHETHLRRRAPARGPLRPPRHPARRQQRPRRRRIHSPQHPAPRRRHRRRLPGRRHADLRRPRRRRRAAPARRLHPFARRRRGVSP
ncbi:cytochrome c oxidase subunit II [Nannocystis pusilla]|uniref:cytochrome c oxidase subunit II n=1 Tax=Nannocystis pusilla TaxID=889268 RepID=UPI003B79D213